MSRKLAIRLLIVLVAFSVGIFSWYGIGRANSKTEHFKIGARDYALGAEGDSFVETSDIPAKDNIPAQGKSKKEPDGFFANLFAPEAKTLTLAYTCVTEKLVVDQIVPAFQKYWYDKTGEEVNFQTGYSLPDFDTMATSISGQPVQILIMSSSTNAEARGYSHTKWHDTAKKGVVFSLPQVLLVRKGNPLRLKSFADLAIPGVRVMHLSPVLGTGGGVWPVWAFYGSALKQTEVTSGAKNYEAAVSQFRKIQDNTFYDFTDFPLVKKAFLSGLADVVVCSENSALAAVKDNDSIEMVVPPYTIVNDFAVYKMNNNLSSDDEEAADGFVDFLFSREAQEYAAENGYRPSDPAVLVNYPKFKELKDPFPLSYLGEQTDMKKKIILDKWVKNNNSRPD